MWTIELECPSCGNLLEVEARRWHTKTVCACCKQLLFVEFDFTVLEDGDEWDHYWLKKMEESDYHDDHNMLELVKCKKVDDL